MKKSSAPLPTTRPFRDAALIYASLTVVFIIIELATGANMIVAVPLALGCFVLATAYSWWRIRQRLAAEEQDS